jgi:hypothetical protein
MVDEQQHHQQQPSQAVQVGAERALSMLRNGSKNIKGVKPWVLDCSRKRGRPKKKTEGWKEAEAMMLDLTVEDPVEDALDHLNDNIENEQAIKKRKYIRWTDEDKRTILEKHQEFKGKGKKHPMASTVAYFATHRGPITGGKFLKYYQNLRESHLRSWVKVKENVGRKPGRPLTLQPKTHDAIIQHIKDLLRVEHDSTGFSTYLVGDTINSTTLIPQIQAVIRKHGEGSKLDDGSFKVSTTWVNNLCRKLGLSMRSKTRETYKEPEDWKEQMEKFKYQMAYLVKSRGYSKDDVYNMDQTGCPLTSRSKTTRAKIGSKDVVANNKPEKHQFSLVPVISASGEKLPLQFVFQGVEFDKRNKKKCFRSIPDSRNNFKSLKERYPGCIYNQTDTHWSTPGTNLDLIEHIILPHAEKRWAEKRAKGEQTGNQLLLLLDNWKVQASVEFKTAVQKKFGEKVKLRYLPPNMTHRLQPLDVCINSALKAKIKAIFNHEHGKKIAHHISTTAEAENLTEKILQAENGRKPKMKREDAIDCTYKGWQAIDTTLVTKAWRDSIILDAWDTEIQSESVRLFEAGLLFPADPGTTKVNVFPDVEPCDAPIQMLEDKATTSEDEEYTLHDSEDETRDDDLSEEDNSYDPSCQPRGRRSGTRSNTKS